MPNNRFYNNKAEAPNVLHSRGVTLLEIFVALGALVVVLSFAAAPLERISARIDLDIARNNVVRALGVARQSAVRANVPVRVYLSGNTADPQLPRFQLIAGFSSLRDPVDPFSLPRYSLPEHVRVTVLGGLSEKLSVIEYLPQGRPAQEGMIKLSSERNPDYVIDIAVDGAPILQAPASLRARRAFP